MFSGQIWQKSFRTDGLTINLWQGRWGVSASQKSINFIPCFSCKLALLAFLPVHFLNLSVLHLPCVHGNIHFTKIPQKKIKSDTQYTSLPSVYVCRHYCRCTGFQCINIHFFVSILVKGNVHKAFIKTDLNMFKHLYIKAYLIVQLYIDNVSVLT